MKFKNSHDAWKYIIEKRKLIPNMKRRDDLGMLLSVYTYEFVNNPAGLGHHHTQKGGLVIHTAQVLHTALDLFKKYRKHMPGITEENVYVVAVLHDLAKCRCYKKILIPIGVTGDTVLRKKMGLEEINYPLFEYNKDFKQEHDIWTIAEANIYGLKLSYDESIAIMYTHGGWSPLVIGNNFYKNKIDFSKLSTIMHCADMLNSQVVKK